MERRVVFNSGEIRNLFFGKVLEYFNLKNWTEMRKHFNIPRSMLELYRNGRLTLPEELYERLTTQFREDKISFNKNISFLDSNWGRVKAGKITYSKHKNIFEEGRRKAISVIRKRAHKFDLNISLNTELAYFIGLFIGDGFTNKYASYYIIQFTGDKKEERFYQTLFSDYCKNLFNIIPKIREDRVCNAIRVNLYSLDLFNLITKRFKISAGRKSRTVLIPQEILSAKPEIIKACIRGLYDAEGCVFFDRRKSYSKPYPRIELHMCNLELLKQVSEILDRFGIKSTLGTSANNLRVTIYTEEQIRRFVREIGFSNPKHLEKLKYF